MTSRVGRRKKRRKLALPHLVAGSIQMQAVDRISGIELSPL
jgi:hypothetical protein